MNRLSNPVDCLRLPVLRLPATIVMLWTIAAAPAVRANEPPRPGEIAQLKRSGEFESRLAKAKALGNDKIDSGLLGRAVYNARVQALQQQGINTGQVLPAPPLAWKLMPTKGNVKVFALLIDFVDYPAYGTNTQAGLQSVLFGDGKIGGTLQNPYPYESLTNYYKRASYNQLDFSSSLSLGIYHSPYNRSSVVQTSAGREALIKTAVTYFKSLGVNFAQFDNDGDGKIEYFMVLWTGPDTGWANFWWAYQTSFGDSTFTVDGKTLGKYSWQWEYNSGGTSSGPFNPRVSIHETGHALGLPDYYDYNGSIGPSGGLGGLDMMDSNWGDHNAFSKWVLEWITPTVVAAGSQSITLNPSGTNADAVVIMPNATATGSSGEFFVAQNRYRVGNDPNPTTGGAYPTDGMLIWHVDSTLNAAGTDWAYDNSYTTHKMLKLMQADGLDRIETSGAAADAAMYYQPGKALGPVTTPNSSSYLGVDTGVNITSITTAGSLMTATFRIDSPHVLPTLTVVKAGNGAGLITSAPVGINCATDCAQSYPSGTIVTLTATSPGNRFAGWSGGCSGTGTCTLMLTADTTVTATFDTTMIVNEDFDPASASLPTGWSMAVTAGSTSWWTQYTTYNSTGGAGAAALGATSASSASYDGELRTPAMNLSSYDSVGLEFKTSVESLSETAQVDVSANGAAGPWTTVWSKTGLFLGPQTVNVDLTAAAARKANAMVRFRHSGTSVWWVLDDIKIMAASLPPGSFALTSPANAATGVSATPTLTWAAASGAASYDVYLGTTNPPTLVINTASTSYTPGITLASNQLYYWQVVAKNVTGNTSSSVWSFTTGTAPGSFVLSSPASGATGVSASPALSWTASSGATSYDVYLGATSPPAFLANVTSTTHTPAGSLNLNQLYYWQIVAKSSTGSRSSAVWSFTTVVPAPGSFALSSPAAGTTGVSVTPTLSWTASTNAASYDVYVGTTNPPPFAGNSTATTYTLPAALAAGTFHYWKVVAKNANGSVDSAIWYFTTVPAPGAFLIYSPADTAVNVSQTPTLTWTASANAASYDVYLGTTNPPVLATNTTATSYTPPTLAAGTLHYWKVVAKNSAGSTPSTTSSFTTLTPPGSFSLSAPTCGATAVSLTPTLTWTASAGASYYEVYFGTTNPPALVTYAYTPSYTPGTLPANTQHFWKIVARNSFGSTSSSACSFTTLIPPGSFSLAAPAYGATSVALTPTLSWTASASATSYDVYLGATNPPPLVGNSVTTSYTPAAALTAGTLYYWKVVAKNTNGSLDSALSYFTTVSAPGALVLYAPADTSTNVSQTPTLMWSASNGAASYDVYLGVTNPPALVTNTTATTFSPPTLAAGTLHYWKVVAKNSAGSTPSATASFTTLTPPGSFSPSAPVCGATAVSLTPTLTWTASAGASYYEVYFGATNPPALVTYAYTPSYTPGTLPANTQHFWKIVARNSFGSTSSSVCSFTTLIPPGSFSLAAPAYGASSVALTPTLSWTASAGATSYDVYLGATNPPPLVGNSVTTSFTPAAPLTAGTVYYWKVVAKNTNGSLDSTNWYFTTVSAPGALILYSPADTATNVSQTPTLMWSASAGAASYDVYLGTTNPPALVTNTTGTTFTPPALAAGTLHYWKVVAKNSAGSTPSATASFTTLTPPGAFALSAPGCGATAVSLTPTLTWTASAGATYYEVYFGTTNPPALVTYAYTPSYSPGALAPNTQYFWKIVSRNNYGSTSSSVCSFTTLIPPGSFSLAAPSYGASSVALTPALSWTASTGATSYDVYLGATNPPPLVGNSVTTSYTPAVNLAAGTLYYWKVVAKNTNGSLDSATWYFTTVAAPGALILYTPADTAVGVSLTPTLMWSASNGAASYDVYLGTTNPPQLLTNTTATTYIPPTLAPGTLFYWRVVAKNSAGATSSPISSFTTLTPPGGFSLTSPASGATGVSRTPTLTWSASNGVNYYEVYLGTTSPPAIVAYAFSGSYAPPTLAPNTQYFWKVVARNQYGATETSVRAFTTGP